MHLVKDLLLISLFILYCYDLRRSLWLNLLELSC